MRTNGTTKHIVAIGKTAVVSRALYDDLARQIAEAHRMAERYGVRCCTLAGAIDELGKYAVANGWDCEADMAEYHDWLETVDDVAGRI